MAQPWPATLPQTPLIRGYADKKRDARMITEVQAGEPKIRRLYTAVPRDITCMFVMSIVQFTELMDFFEVDLEEGTLRFEWELPNLAGVREFRFMETPDYNVLSCDLYEVTIKLECLPGVISA